MNDLDKSVKNLSEYKLKCLHQVSPFSSLDVEYQKEY